MNTASVLQAVRRFWWVTLLFALAGAILGALPEPATTAETESTTYSAHFSILLSTDDLNGVQNSPLVNQLAVFATRGDVPVRAAVKLGRPEAQGPVLAAQIQITVDTGGAAVDISTTQTSAEQAVGIVNAFGDELVTFIAEHQDDVRTARLDRLLKHQAELEKDIKDLQKDLAASPDDELVQAKIDAASRQYGIVSEQYDSLSADTATLLLTPIERGVAIAQTNTSGGLAAPKSRTSRGLLGLLIGLSAGIGVALVLVRSDRRVRTRNQAEHIFGGAASVTIPLVPGSNESLEVRPDNHDQLSDAYRTLRSIVTFSQAALPRPRDGRKARVTLVIGAGPGDGKTSVAANLAAAAAEAGRRVIAVNADFRRPTLMARIVQPPPPPLPLTLDQLHDTPLRQLLRRTGMSNLVVLDLTSIVASPGILARATAQVLPEAAAMCEVVVIDSSPIGLTAEVLDLLPMVDTIVMVIRLDHTLTGAAVHTLELVRSLTKAQLLLAIIGDAMETASYQEYGMQSHHHGPAAARDITRPTARPVAEVAVDDNHD